ncbi:MAG: exosortase/archaeosortase family protein [Isosphaeraceae bacterium]
MSSVPVKGPAPWSPTKPQWAAIAAVLLTFVASYYPSFRGLVDQWNRDPNYSYGFFVIPIAAAILWTRREMLDPARLKPSWWGLVPLVAMLAVRYPLFEWNEQYVETATIPVALAGVTLFAGGWHLLWVCGPALVFLFFMLPLPPSLNYLLAGPLQTVATNGSVFLLQLMGLPVMAEGNVIVVGQETLEVARACNGLSMLLSFVTLITATVMLIRRPLYEKILLFLSSIPIALISNILRITGTALVYHWVGHKAGEKIAHDMAGFAMMPIALALVWVELKLYSWLVVEVEEMDAAQLLRRKPRSPRTA